MYEREREREKGWVPAHDRTPGFGLKQARGSELAGRVGIIYGAFGDPRRPSA